MEETLQKEQIKEIINKFPVEIKKVDINSVFRNEWNPNKQSEIIYRTLKNSVKNIGFMVPVLVREIEKETYEIIDGEHKYNAAKDLQYTEILIANLGKVDDMTAKALTISMNTIKGEHDILEEAQVLKDISAGQTTLFDFIPFEKRLLEERIKLLDFDFSQYDKEDVKIEDKIQIKNVCQFIFKNENMLRRFHEETENVEIKVLIEQYFQWVRNFCDNIKDIK